MAKIIENNACYKHNNINMKPEKNKNIKKNNKIEFHHLTIQINKL